MTNLSDVSQVEMKRLMKLVEKAIGEFPGKKVTVNRSGVYSRSPNISTVKTHSTLNDSFLTVEVDNV